MSFYLVLEAALEYNISCFTDYDISVLCCTCKYLKNILEYTLERRLYANECKSRGDRYRLLFTTNDKQLYLANLNSGDIVLTNKHGYNEVIYVCSRYYIHNIITCAGNSIGIASIDILPVIMAPRTDII